MTKEDYVKAAEEWVEAASKSCYSYRFPLATAQAQIANVYATLAVAWEKHCEVTDE